jgi:predicted nucleic acid-binding protein
MRVVDASVVMKWHIADEIDAEAAQTLRRIHGRFAVPDLLFVEAATVVWKNVRRGLMSPDRATQVTDLIAEGPFDVYDNQSLSRDAVRIAMARDITPYDASYIALALSLGTDCVTADRKLFSKLQGSPLGRHVTLLAEYVH